MRAVGWVQGGPRTKERYDTLRANLERLWKAAEPTLGLRLTNNLYHDISNDIRIITERAVRWEDHCRKTGQNQWCWTNEDGTPDLTATPR